MPHVLYTIAAVLLVLWLGAVGSSYTLGGSIHLLFLVAIEIILIRVIGGRNPL